MKKIILNDSVIQIDFKEGPDLLKTFLRFQEYYESPEFKNKIFTLEEYKAWYMKINNNDVFTYYTDWSGCNVPSYVFDFFREGHFNPLSTEEKALLEILPKEGRFYVIGTFDGGSDDVIEHEKAHGLYYSNPSYKEKVDSLLNEYHKELGEVQKMVLSLGYHEAVLNDEVHAYISADADYLDNKSIAYPKELHFYLKALREKYSKE